MEGRRMVEGLKKELGVSDPIRKVNGFSIVRVTGFDNMIYAISGKKTYCLGNLSNEQIKKMPEDEIRDLITKVEADAKARKESARAKARAAS